MPDSVYTPPKSDVAHHAGASSGGITPGMLDHLGRTRPWVLLIAILVMILALITFFAGGAMVIGSNFMMSTNPEMQAMGGGALIGMGALYILMAIVFYVIPAVLLFRYSGAIKNAVNSGIGSEVETALSRQASFWTFVGIMSLIGVVFAIIGIAAAIIIPMMQGGM